MNRRFFIKLVAIGLGKAGLGKLNPSPAPVPSLIVPKDNKYTELLWGTYGKDGLGRMKLVKLGDCTSEHLQNIIRTESWHIGQLYHDAICHILLDRGKEIPHPTITRSMMLSE